MRGKKIIVDIYTSANLDAVEEFRVEMAVAYAATVYQVTAIPSSKQYRESVSIITQHKRTGLCCRSLVRDVTTMS